MYNSTDFAGIIKKLYKELRSVSETWFFSIISEIEKESTAAEVISPILVEGSNVDIVLKGFQLTCVVGFCLKEKYVRIEDLPMFEKMLKQSMAENNYSKCELYNERYLDCQGDIECLENKLTSDILELLDYIPGIISFSHIIKRSIAPFAIISQAVTARSFGDEETAKKLKKLLKI